MIEAPFTTKQVAALNAWQECGWVHPFTCGSGHEGQTELVATADGWICPDCDYEQKWAHEFMADPLPSNPLAAPSTEPPIEDAGSGGVR